MGRSDTEKIWGTFLVQLSTALATGHQLPNKAQSLAVSKLEDEVTTWKAVLGIFVPVKAEEDVQETITLDIHVPEPVSSAPKRKSQRIIQAEDSNIEDSPKRGGKRYPKGENTPKNSRKRHKKALVDNVSDGSDDNCMKLKSIPATTAVRKSSRQRKVKLYEGFEQQQYPVKNTVSVKPENVDTGLEDLRPIESTIEELQNEETENEDLLETAMENYEEDTLEKSEDDFVENTSIEEDQDEQSSILEDIVFAQNIDELSEVNDTEENDEVVLEAEGTEYDESEFVPDESSLKKSTFKKKKRPISKYSIRGSFKCDLCKLEQVFPTLGKLNTHKLSSHMDKPPKCEICSKEFKSLGGLNNHIENHKIFRKCDECDFTAQTSWGIKLHVMSVHGIRQEEISEKGSRTMVNMEIGGEDGEVPERRVRKRTASSEQKRAKLSKTSVWGSFSCEHCQKVFPRKSTLNTHMLSHIDGPIKCDLCNKQFKTLGRLDQHKLSHNSYKWRKCKFCGLKVADHKALSGHIMAVHKDERTKDYVCDICGATFFRKAHLNVHVATHNENPDIPCPHCEKMFTTKHNITCHIRNVHSDRDAVSCSICGTILKSKHSLIIHLRSHFNEKPFRCILCSFTCTSSGQLSNHKKTHLPPAFQCNICNKKFRQKSHLQRHAVMHSGLKCFSCPECKYTCNDNTNLRKHMKTVHNLTLASGKERVVKVERVEQIEVTEEQILDETMQATELLNNEVLVFDSVHNGEQIIEQTLISAAKEEDVVHEVVFDDFIIQVYNPVQ